MKANHKAEWKNMHKQTTAVSTLKFKVVIFSKKGSIFTSLTKMLSRSGISCQIGSAVATICTVNQRWKLHLEKTSPITFWNWPNVSHLSAPGWHWLMNSFAIITKNQHIWYIRDIGTTKVFVANFFNKIFVLIYFNDSVEHVYFFESHSKEFYRWRCHFDQAKKYIEQNFIKKRIS